MYPPRKSTMPENNHLPVPAQNAPVASREIIDLVDLEADKKHPVRNFFRVLRTRKWWVLGVMFGLVAITILVMLIMTPIYRGRVLLQITEDNSVQRLGENDPVSSLLNKGVDRFLATQVGILTSRSLAWQVIEIFNLHEHPEFKELKAKDPTISPHKLKNDMIDLFLGKKLSVYPVKDSYLVEVYFKSSDIELSRQVPNVIAKEYLRLAINRRDESYVLAREWLDAQIRNISRKVQISQKKLHDFGQKADFFGLEDKDNVIIQKYIELGNLLTKAQSERMGKEAQYKQILEKGADAPLITNNQLIVALRQDMVNQEAKVASLSKIFLAGHPDLQAERAKLQEIRGRLQGEVNRLKESVKADYEAAKRAERLVTDAFDKHKEQMVTLQTNLVDFQILKRDLQATEKLFQALLTRLGETAVASTMVPSNVAVVDQSDLPSEPYLPRPALFLALAGVLGLGLGIGVAFLVESLDNSIKNEGDIVRHCHLAHLGHVPRYEDLQKTATLSWKARLFSWVPFLGRRWKAKKAPDLVYLSEPSSLMSESFRQLRSSIMLSRPEHPPRSLLITSPNPYEGKSTVASNMAYSLALEGHRRVVVVDCDMRNPTVHRLFDQPSRPGLTNYLTGNAAKEEIMRSSSPGLTLIPGGPVAPNPAELILSKAFQDLFAELLQDFDHVIIDSPPLLGFADGRILAPMVDGVLLVFKQGATSREAARRARNLLFQVHANVLGGILNQVNLNDGGDYHYYRYYRRYYGNRGDDAQV
ncbi:MAG: polysaccharide biosynthesis tyrosine autokinase [Deltaproteobacteria bacterium]|nr:polysaccharide biosynthesis tyrosine autokinase [Deltaproteobacteria bacterium]